MAKSMTGDRRYLGEISDERLSVVFLLFHSLLFALLSVLILIFFFPISAHLHFLFPSIYLSALRLSTALLGTCLSALSACLLSSAAASLFSASEISDLILSSVSDWSTVSTALTIGHGPLLGSIGLCLKNHGAHGRVVGLRPSRAAAISSLRRARADGVHRHVTCREGHVAKMPFADACFDVAASAGGIGIGGKGLGEMARVLRVGGVGVVWDPKWGTECSRRLREMGMEEVRVSEKGIVSFRKPVPDMC